MRMSVRTMTSNGTWILAAALVASAACRQEVPRRRSTAAQAVMERSPTATVAAQASVACRPLTGLRRVTLTGAIGGTTSHGTVAQVTAAASVSRSCQRGPRARAAWATAAAAGQAALVAAQVAWAALAARRVRRLTAAARAFVAAAASATVTWMMSDLTAAAAVIVADEFFRRAVSLWRTSMATIWQAVRIGAVAATAREVSQQEGHRLRMTLPRASRTATAASPSRHPPVRYERRFLAVKTSLVQKLLCWTWTDRTGKRMGESATRTFWRAPMTRVPTAPARRRGVAAVPKGNRRRWAAPASRNPTAAALAALTSPARFLNRLLRRWRRTATGSHCRARLVVPASTS